MKDSIPNPKTSVFVSLPRESVEQIVEIIGELSGEIAPPEPNCGCHAMAMPPCGDCTTWSYARDLLGRAKELEQSLQGSIDYAQKAAEAFGDWRQATGSEIRESFERLPKPPGPASTLGRALARFHWWRMRQPLEIRK